MDIVMLLRALAFIPICIYIFFITFDMLRRLRKRDLVSSMLFLRFENVVLWIKYSALAIFTGLIAAASIFLYYALDMEEFRVLGAVLEVAFLAMFGYSLRMLDHAMGG